MPERPDLSAGWQFIVQVRRTELQLRIMQPVRKEIHGRA
jgi:hypothetical protein